MNQKKAFTYIELMVVAVVVAILVIAAMPDGDTAAKQEGLEAARLFEADVAYARSKTIARPDDPIVIKIDPDNDTYWLAREADPDVPITHPLTGLPYRTAFGSATGARFTNVQIEASDFGGDQVLGFDSVGSIDQDAAAVLQLTSGSTQMEIQVSPAMASCRTSDSFTVDLTIILGDPLDPPPDGDGGTCGGGGTRGGGGHGGGL